MLIHRRLLLIPVFLFLLTQTTLFAAEINFDSAANYGVGSSPYYGAIGDLNGDGKPDLAVANHGNNNVSILFGNGDGTFWAAANYGAGNGPHALAIGDLNGDGKPDLAVANFYGNNVSILLGNIDGTFQAAANYGAGSNPQSLAIGDLDGDGKPDLAVTNFGSSNVSILLGDGDGTFQAAANYGVGSAPQSVAIGDLNNDGKPDLAVANKDSNNVSILLGDGDGTFQTAVSYGAGNGVYSVAIGDLDGDGKPDLAVTNFGSSNVSILLGDGDGTFQAAANYGVGSAPQSVAIGDLNNDGKPDLAVANQDSNNVSILRGDGDGTFQTAANYNVGIHPVSVAIADLNNDGRPDLAVANINSNNVSVLLNTTDLPAWNASYPRIGAISSTSAEVLVNADRDGDAYLVCLPSGAPAPTPVQIRAGEDAAGTALAANLTDSVTLTADSSASLSCTSLASGTAYDLYAVAADSEGSLQAVPTKLNIPCAPPGTLYVPVSSNTGSYTLNWNRSATSGALYQLEESSNGGGSWSSLGSDLTTNGYAVTGKANGSYTYRVKATGAGYTDSGWRQGGTITVLVSCAPPGVLGVPASTTTGSYTLSWGWSVTAGVVYQLEESSNGGGSWSSLASDLTTNGYAVTGKANGSYTYRVKATKSGYADSGWRTGGTITVLVRCAPPGTLSVPASSTTGSYQLSWGRSATAGVLYQLEESSNGGGSWTTLGSPMTTNVYPLTGKANGSYTYRVKATRGGYADSGWRTGGTVTVLLQLPCAPPGTLYVPSRSTTGSYQLAWGRSATAGVVYQLQESSNGGGSWAALASDLTTNSYSFNGKANGNYTYRVQATRSGYVDSPWRRGGTITVLVSCMPPGRLYVQSFSSTGNYQVSWRQSATAGVVYQLEESSNDGGSWSPVGTDLAVTVQTFTGKGVGSYTYRVKATKTGVADSGWRQGGTVLVF